MAERTTTVGSVALGAIFTGGALALVGTSLPWAYVTDATGTPYLVRLADLNRAAAPLATLWLVFAVGAALASRGSSPWATLARLGTTIFATVGAFFLLSLTVLVSKGTAVVAHAGITDVASRINLGRVMPDVGCLLYAIGLVLIAIGVSGVEIATRGFQPNPSPPGGRPAVHRVVLALAVLLGVISAVLPWYRGSPTDVARPVIGIVTSPGPDDVQAWLGVYRAGLVVCLGITVLALVLQRHAPWLRVLGLIVGTAVSVLLLTGYVLLWRQPTLRYATDRVGLGYHLGLVAMLLLTASFLALPSGGAEAPRKAHEAQEREAGAEELP